MSLQKDFDFVQKIAEQFFKRVHIKKTLKTIDECSMTGWEKWLQIELASFLQDHPEVKAWWRESSYQLDKRVIASRKKCAVDFLVHEKAKHSHMAIELKQTKSATACIQGMLKDKRKIQSIKGAEYDIRSVWCIGVHHSVGEDEVSRLVNYYSDKAKRHINKKHFSSKRIGNSKYCFTIF